MSKLGVSIKRSVSSKSFLAGRSLVAGFLLAGLVACGRGAVEPAVLGRRRVARPQPGPDAVSAAGLGAERPVLPRSPLPIH